jgi:transcriptional regulator with XRE-family HTH domain
MTFGNKIRQARESKGLLLRQIAAQLEVDTATISKIENGLRNATKKQVVDLSSILDIPYTILEASWMGSKIYQLLQEVNDPSEALQVAEEQILYSSSQNS